MFSKKEIYKGCAVKNEQINIFIMISFTGSVFLPRIHQEVKVKK